MAVVGGGSLNKYLQYSHYERMFQMVRLEILIAFIQTETRLPTDGISKFIFTTYNSVIRWLIPNDHVTPGAPVPCTHASMTVGSGRAQGRARFWAVTCTTSGVPSLTLLSTTHSIKSQHSRCLFRLSHRLIAEHPLENQQIHIWKRLGDREMLRKKHRGRLPATGEQGTSCLWITQ